MSGTLFLLPAPLAGDTAVAVLPLQTLEVARRLDLYFAENAKTTRAYLKAIAHPRPLAELEIIEIGHHPDAARVDGWLAKLDARDAAIVSEAGCPGIADPGDDLVARAHALGITVRPLVGPSSLLLALMASGLNGQAFRFLGYLPQDAVELAAHLRDLERASRTGETQLWIETPYRNDRMLDAVLAACSPDTRLSVAVDLTAPAEAAITRTVAGWKALAPAHRPLLHKRPAVFALLAAARQPASGRGSR
jgi:16S rRNA (cytidine1402-2'-O)-methyltransferase